MSAGVLVAPVGLPPAVVERLRVLAQTLPPEQLAQVAGRLRAKVAVERQQRVQAWTDVDSPGGLAIRLGHEQTRALAMLDGLLVRAASGEQVQAIVELAPRHGKTDRLLKVGSLWRLNRDPACRIMMISGGRGLVVQSSRWVRDELERPGGGYRVQPRADLRAVDDWQLAGTEGGVFTGSLSSRIIGRGTNLLLVDDLLGSVEEAESKVQRDKAYSFLQASFGRMEPGASVIIVNSRWHPDDPIGRLRRDQPGAWEIVSIPALAEAHAPREDQPAVCVCGDRWQPRHGDPLGRKAGEPLWPNRYDAAALEAIRLRVGSHIFAAQFQQRPRPRGGGLWQQAWIDDVRIRPMSAIAARELLRPRAVAVDPSASDDDAGDEAGIVCGGRNPDTGQSVIVADLSGRRTPEGWARTALIAAVELDATVVYESNLTPVFMRRTLAGAWQQLRQDAAAAGGLIDPVIGTMPVPLPLLMPAVEPVRAKQGKILRAEPVAQRYEQRKVSHAGVFPLLEDQLLTWKPTDTDSPDRMDADVHLVTWLGDAAPAEATIEDMGGGASVPTGAGSLAGYR